MTSAYALAIVAASIALYVWRYGRIVSPDGGSYLLAACGVRQPRPFRWRLLPALIGRLCRPWRVCGAKVQTAARIGGWDGVGRTVPGLVLRWSTLSLIALLACGPLLAWYAEQRGAPGLLAVAIWAALPWLRSCARMPVLTDQLAMALALAAGCSSSWWALLLFGILAGLVSERAPVFAALFAWSPLPLVGLAAPLLVALLGKPGPLQSWHVGVLDDPFGSAQRSHRDAPLWHLVGPWGLALVGLAPTAQLCATLAVAYGQIVIATDRVRLYQWAAPALCVSAAGVVVQWPAWAVAAALAVHATWPWSEVRG